MRFFSLMLSGILLCTAVHAQYLSSPEDEANGPSAYRWKNGFLVTVKGDTIRGRVKVPDFFDVNYDYQRTVSFRAQNGHVGDYAPGDLSSFSYYEGRDSITTLQAVSSPEGDGPVFLKLYCNGACKVYGYTITEFRGAGNTGLGPGDRIVRSSLLPTEKKYIQLRGSEFFPLRRMGFRKNMKSFFAACPEIVNRLNTNFYNYENWQTMVRDFNCGVCK